MLQHDPTSTVRRGPSRWWLTASVVVFGLAAIAGIVGFSDYREMSRPIGEGELFFEEAGSATSVVTEALSSGLGLDGALRRARNELEVEAVAAIDSGTPVAATSATLLDVSINALIESANERGRFMAVAAPTGAIISIDGVAEWQTRDILYQVHQPASAETPALVLYYDIGELLARRARAVQVQPWTIQLMGAAVGLGAVGVLLVYGRSRAVSRYRRVELETGLLREHAAELESTNAQLDMAREEAERALALAEETNRIRSEFVLMINHELRTPLASVVTGAELLQADHGLTPEDKRRVLDDMVLDGNRLHAMISQMLAVARIENRGFEFGLQPVPLLDLCRRIEEAHPKLVADHLGMDSAVLQTVRVHTDAQSVTQLIASLADNALTHGASTVSLECSPELGFDPQLVRGAAPTQAVHFTVIDDGPGIDPEFLPRAFEKFEKTSFSSGTGLGLYVADLMVSALEGAISVHTSPNGTRIAVTLPAELVPMGLEVVA